VNVGAVRRLLITMSAAQPAECVCSGLLNLFGVFQVHYSAVRLPTVPASKISLIGSMQAFLLLFIGVLTGLLLDAGYMSNVVALGTFFLGFRASLTNVCHACCQFMPAQGIVVVIGSGCLFLQSVAIVPQWSEPKRRNLALGIGSSVGGVVFPTTFHYLLSQILVRDRLDLQHSPRQSRRGLVVCLILLIALSRLVVATGSSLFQAS
jgi:hypothetical protein